ncbi:MAG: ATP-dependent DNA helicase RecG [Aquiluna sp.]|nr:ATP-dependent DNA helicase RecG [Aquiluna sp.]
MIVCVLTETLKLDSILGDRTAKAFAKQFGITNLSELLEHYPRRYSKRGELTPISSLPIGEVVTVVGEVVSTSSRRLKGRSGNLLEVVITDGSKTLTLAFFNQHWREKELHSGVRGLFSGRIGVFSNKLQLAHPDYELFSQEIDDSEAKAWAELPIPIYPASGTLSTWKIQKSVELALSALGEIQEVLPANLLKKHKMLSLSESIKQIHVPKIDSEWQAARDSLRFHEAMLLQIQLAQSRSKRNQVEASIRTAGELLGTFDKRLPFELTDGQRIVGQEIESDLASGHPMHRLLQGEVGSGKTLVALRAVLTVAQSGGQSALLAPTEVLASQHFESIRNSLGDELSKALGLRLLTGQMSTAERKIAMLDIASGKCLLAIGTHALISEKVQFFDLSFVVVDEQHRFGVGQREALRAKGKTAPHVLTMTATPIPRTMAITVFGDLEISTLVELPKGRQPISSHVVELAKPALVARVWQRVAEEVKVGRQAFVVCPRIDGELVEEDFEPSEDEEEQGPAPAAAVEVVEALKLNPALAGLNIGLMHGRQSLEEKTAVMQAFTAGEVEVLVSTTVIEVGVNVPNATAMVILDADRFGISQLHQLRGRVGRGAHPGVCLMVSASEPGSLAMERLNAVASTVDGFKLSELDLEIRGEGDVLGNLQSGGKSQLKLLRVIKDAELIQQCKGLAQDLIDAGLPAETVKALELADAAALKRS